MKNRISIKLNYACADFDGETTLQKIKIFVTLTCRDIRNSLIDTQWVRDDAASD